MPTNEINRQSLQINYFRYRGHQYDCNLATTCVFGGKKPMDLCNGGMIWSCCVDRDKVDFVDPNLGAVKDARCGEVHTSQARDEYVINIKETINYIV